MTDARASREARRDEIRASHYLLADEAREDGDPGGARVAMQNLEIREESWRMTDANTIYAPEEGQ